MTILVTAASRHGGTAGIAEAIARALTDDGLEAVVLAPQAVESVAHYEAVVLGSAVYMGHWLEPAMRFAEEHRADLRGRPVWLFSSGPVGDPPKPVADPIDVADLVTATGARDHRQFAGRLDRRDLGVGERVVTGALRVPLGDFRPWPAIEAWAAYIARSLEPAPAIA